MQRIKPDIKHVSTSDFPKTPWTPSFGLRKALARVFNYARQYPEKMVSFKAHLVFMLQQVQAWEEQAAGLEQPIDAPKRPLMSGTYVRQALTTEQDGSLTQSFQLEQKPSDALEMERHAPLHVDTVQQPALAIPSSQLPKAPPMPQQNPLKPGYGVPAATTIEPEQVEQVEPSQELQPVEQLTPVTPVAPVEQAPTGGTLPPLPPIQPQQS